MTIGFLPMTMAEALHCLTFIVQLHQIAIGAETEGVVLDLKEDHGVPNQGVGHLFHPGDRHTVGHLCPEVVDLELQVEIGAAIDLPKNVKSWGGGGCARLALPVSLYDKFPYRGHLFSV